MGSSRSPAQLTNKLRRATVAMETAPVVGVRATAKVFVESVRSELANAGVRGRLSGVGRNGAAISVNAKVTPKGRNSEAFISMRGPAQLIENDTAPHEIRPKKGGRALKLADGNVRRIAHHPGTKGKQPFAKGVQRGMPEATAAFNATVMAALRKAF